MLVFQQLTVNDGLSQNAVTSIIQSKDGYILIGTFDGLNIYDGYTIKTKRHSSYNKNSLINNRILSLTEDSQGKIWICTEDGLSLYEIDNDKFVDISEILKILPSYSVNTVLSDNAKNLWIGTKKGLLIIENGDFSKARFVKTLQGENISKIVNDKHNNTWISTFRGLYFIPHTKTLDNIENEIIEIDKARNKIINVLFCDKKNDIWAGGINEILCVNYQYINRKLIVNVDDKRKELAATNYFSIFSIAEGNNDDLWFGCKTSGLYHVTVDELNKIKNVTFYDDTENYGCLSHNDVRSVLVDKSNVLWVGTNNGINYVDLTSPLFYTFKPLLSDFKDKSAFKGMAVQSVYVDKKSVLWIGGKSGSVIAYNLCNNRKTEIPVKGTVFTIMQSSNNDIWILSSQQLLRINSKNAERQLYKTEEVKIGALLSEPNVGWMIFSLCEDNFGNIWIGANGEIIKWNLNSNQFTKYGNKDNIPSNVICYLYQDPYSNTIWAGTKGGGALKINYNQNDNSVNIKRLVYNPSSTKIEICSNYIWTIYRDKNKNLWVGTDAGLGKVELDKKNNIIGFSLIDDSELADLKIVAINEDMNTRLWLNGSQGLYCFDYRNGRIQKYSYADGLQSNIFTEASYISEDGWLFVGGINGLNYVNTNEIHINRYLSQPIITDFKIYNKSIGVGEEIEGEVVLKKTLNSKPEIELNYKQNNFSISFSSDHYASVKKKKFRYKLDGYDVDWIETGSDQRIANYSNLPVGTYIFRLNASNNHLVWSEFEKTVTITILPPPWRTWWAYMIYTILFFVILFTVLRYFYLRGIWKRDLQIERLEKEKVQELAIIKERFFTNITHELRTPLLLITEPVKDLLEQSHSKDTYTTFRLNIIERNAKRLLILINQLLDVRRLMNQDLPLSTSENNLSENIANILNGFEHKAVNSGISIVYDYPKVEIVGCYDKDKIEKIMFNLISNAFKHSTSGGSIVITLHSEKVDADNTTLAKISISDTGSGISEQDKKYIFDMFYRGDKRDIASSGIGLYFVKVLLESHKGSIHFDSEVGKGTTFYVSFPIDKQSYNDFISTEKNDSIIDENDTENLSENQISTPKHVKKIVLIVEDNADLRDYIKSCLDTKFRVIVAENGDEGYKMACKYQPDLVLSDILMPIMDGIAFTKMMKTDKRVAHIPIIIHSVKNEEYSINEAIEAGANDYIPKPVNYKTLTMKIENTLNGLENFAKKVIVDKMIEPPTVEVISNDDTFLKSVNKVIDKNIDKENFGVNELSNELLISRMQLNRQIKRITGQQPLEFMRNYRLLRAAQLLETGELRILEVMDSVGFVNQSRFNKFFKEKYGITPNEYLNQFKEKRKNLF